VRHRTNFWTASDVIATWQKAFDIELTLVLNGSILRVPVDTKTRRAEAMPCIDRGLTVTEKCSSLVWEPMYEMELL
jgi:hypothetical protein